MKANVLHHLYPNYRKLKKLFDEELNFCTADSFRVLVRTCRFANYLGKEDGTRGTLHSFWFRQKMCSKLEGSHRSGYKI